MPPVAYMVPEQLAASPRALDDATPADPRAALVAALAAAIRDGAAAGDLTLARVAHDALGRLLGTGAGAGAVVDLASRRKAGA
ncbi:MAG: hypothetical protein WCJ30_20900 [Deltaproteobacteria bacterium]